MTTDNYAFCANCVNRIFNPNVTLSWNKGNIMSGKVAILPFTDFDSTDLNDKEKVFNNVYEEITGLPVYNDICVMRTIKCNNVPNYNTYMAAAQKCRMITFKQLYKYDVRHLFLFGNAWQCMFDCAPIRHYKSGDLHIYHNYSPGVAYYDADKFAIFKQQFAEDIKLSNSY